MGQSFLKNLYTVLPLILTLLPVTYALCRKLIVSKKQDLSIFMDELLLSELVLSYSPKSDHAWSHR